MVSKDSDKTLLLAGIDVGSTTTKIAVVDSTSKELLFSDYTRHGAAQRQSVLRVLSLLHSKFPNCRMRLAFTGSGAKPIAQMLNLPFIQEVVSNSIALRAGYGNVRTAIELGGQDAKMIFFRPVKGTDAMTVADMRMNGSCAGGTGAFIDEIAAILKVPIEDFDALAEKGTCVYDISGRCGVYAKTDIQPLLNQGVSKQDLALSAFHAIAKQTIGGLAQGLDVKAPVVFEGGPLTFNPTLVKVFAQRLNLSPQDVLLPDRPEIIVAYGAALSLEELFAEKAADVDLSTLIGLLKDVPGEQPDQGCTPAFFSSDKERADFRKRHALPDAPTPILKPGQHIRAYLGIDSGSTTTKFVLMDEEGNLLDAFYAPNEGDPLMVAKMALIAMRDRFQASGVTLDIIAVGTTGYGEMLFSKAFRAQHHVVETVAHARAAEKYVKDATFILDIGGQDMKAIWLSDGVITNIVVNEACSSGCGSFLENFAASLHIPTQDIAETAFSSKHPAALGSRCTVFMNSSIVTEQRNGKLPSDIMAGLCRSIIENVFTKVIRVSNLESLGNRIVVQGGTFRNDAVLRAMEQYIGREVTRPPYPGMMGAIGVALLTKEHFQGKDIPDTFIGLDRMDDFSYVQQPNSPCPFCANHCKRSVIAFSNGDFWITNNRCERGEILGDRSDPAVLRRVKAQVQQKKHTPNLFRTRRELLFQEYPYPKPLKRYETVIGLPRVLSYWETMPFWNTFWRALGFSVKISDNSTRKMYEAGLSAVASDTVCFPAKLVHGHIRNLAEHQVDRIFMPSITNVESENTVSTSQAMCAVVKGYPLVIGNADNPQEQWNIPFDTPVFHWYRTADRNRQLVQYIKNTFHIPAQLTLRAIRAGDQAQEQFHTKLKAAGQAVLDQVARDGTYAVVLASRPYQNDALVNHDLPDMFAALGIPVLTADALPGIEAVDLSRSRLDATNNYHARMLSSAILAAQSQHLEYVQIVSFGCGHDAYLSDEVIRLMKEISGKPPLVLKLDESDIQGPLRIRVRSFIETVNMRRARNQPLFARALADPYPAKYKKSDRKKCVVLVPNTSHAFCRIMSAAFAAQGVLAEPLEVGREEAIRLGKQYVHNDICFPAQIVIGEILAALRSGRYDDTKVAVGMGKYIGDCRLTHYSALLRKALDEAGYAHVPILTNDNADSHNIHPGFKLNLCSSVRIAFALPMIDILEELLRKIRPYELEPGSAERAFEQGMDEIVDGLEHHGVSGAKRGFTKAIRLMCDLAYDRSNPRPQVLIVGEYLLNFHPGANHEIERYLEQNGFEIIEARMTDVIRKTYFTVDRQIKEYHLEKPPLEKTWYSIANQIFEIAHDSADAIAKAHPLYERACRLPELVKESDPIIYHTFDTGEGVLIPGEILHHAKQGCRTFVILQPFGCLPNHVVGRGIVKRLKELYPDAQILPLDYDPDVSFANIENRLQMLMANLCAKQKVGNATGAVYRNNDQVLPKEKIASNIL